MKIKFLPISLVIIFFVIFFIFYKGLQNTNVYTPNLNIEKKIPSFKAKLLNASYEVESDKIFNNENFFLVNIWASWCIPCREEHFFLMKLSEMKNIKIIGLNYKDNPQKANLFLKELNNPYEFIFLDADGTLAIEWGAYGVPETFLINKQKIIKKIIGPLNDETFLEIKEIIQ